MVALAVAAVDTAAVAADAPVAAVVVDTAAVAVDAPVAAAVVDTAVAVEAATKQHPAKEKGPSGPFLLPAVFDQGTSARRFRGRPANALSNNLSGSMRKSLATQPICQGITR